MEGEEDSGSSLFTALRAAADAEAEAADDELLAYSQEVEEEVDAADAAKQLPLSIAVPAHLLSRAAGANPRSRASRMVTAPKRSAEQQPAALAGEASHSGLATVAGLYLHCLKVPVKGCYFLAFILLEATESDLAWTAWTDYLLHIRLDGLQAACSAAAQLQLSWRQLSG